MAVQHPLCQATTASHHRGTNGNHFLHKYYKEHYEDLCLQHPRNAEVASMECGCLSQKPGEEPSAFWQAERGSVTAASQLAHQLFQLMNKSSAFANASTVHTLVLSYGSLVRILDHFKYSPSGWFCLGGVKGEHPALRDRDNLAASVSGQLEERVRLQCPEAGQEQQDLTI